MTSFWPISEHVRIEEGMSQSEIASYIRASQLGVQNTVCGVVSQTDLTEKKSGCDAG